MTNFQRSILALVAGEIDTWSFDAVLIAAERIRQALVLPEEDLCAAICGPTDVVLLVRGGVMTEDDYRQARAELAAEEAAEAIADALGFGAENQAQAAAAWAAHVEGQAASQDDDPGAHYRYGYTVALTPEDIARGFVRVNLDPYRIADIYALGGGPREHVVKKGLRGSGKGHSDRALIRELRSCIDRWEEMLDEDERAAA